MYETSKLTLSFCLQYQQDLDVEPLHAVRYSQQTRRVQTLLEIRQSGTLGALCSKGSQYEIEAVSGSQLHAAVFSELQMHRSGTGRWRCAHLLHIKLACLQVFWRYLETADDLQQFMSMWS